MTDKKKNVHPPRRRTHPKRQVIPRYLAADVLHFGRFISSAATALAVTQLSVFLQRILFFFPHQMPPFESFPLLQAYYLLAEALLLHLLEDLDIQLCFSAVPDPIKNQSDFQSFQSDHFFLMVFKNTSVHMRPCGRNANLK